MNENDLKKFIAFTKDLLNSTKDKQEYAWFIELYKEEIANRFFNSQAILSIPNTNKFDAITEKDIIRVKSYLNFIDRKAINYGKVFYKNIQSTELKAKLIEDFKEMKIALMQDDIIEFGRRVCLQVENIFNCSLNALNIHNLILGNLAYYQNLQPNWSQRPFNFHQSFFDRNGQPVELSKVSFNTKSVFLSIHFNYQVNARNIKDLYFLRNKGSHRDQLSPQETQQLNQLIKDFDKNYSFYYKVLFDVVNGIQNI
jgi:hypothetical protein